MDITRFDRLRMVVESLGASQVVSDLEKKFVGRGVEIDDPSRVVTGGSGIYYIAPEGLLTKVIIHIVDKSIQDRYAKNLSHLVKTHQFDSAELIRESHKYHLIKCKTIEQAEHEGWKHKYKMSRRHDGTFFYRYINGNEVIEREGQKLYVCKNCLGVVNQLMGQSYTIDSFKPEDFLEKNEYLAHSLPKSGFIADFCAPNIYASDWQEISRKYRVLVKYQCQEPGCPKPDLSDGSFHKYLHTHHISQDKTNNNYQNLMALCIYCHAKQPNHSLVKQSPDYKQYVQLRNLG